jgi:flagellar hook-associated protein 3 FlgL
MRVDPNYVTNLSASLSQSSLNVQQLTAELSSGLAVSQLSDNPVAAAESQRLSASLSALDSFTKTATTEQGVLQVSDTTLGQVVSQLTSAVSLATEAGNSSLPAAQLSSIGSELSGIRDQVLSLANTDYLGQHLFSGSKGSVTPFTLNTSTSPATVTYNGDTATQSVKTTSGQSIQVSVPGSAIFTANGANVLAALNQLIADVGSGNVAAIGSDTGALSTGLANVSTQRATLDGALSQLNSNSTYAQTQATLLTAEQTQLIQANPAQVATDLSTAETQNQALLQVIASLSNSKNDLFQYIQ